MLDEIRKINWIDLGNAAIPDWIEGIASPEESIRKNSYDAIYDAHLDDLHELSPYIVPFLIELLNSDVQEKQSVLLLLTQITDGAVSVIESKYKTLDIATETMNSVMRGTDVFLSLLINDDLLPWVLQLLRNLKAQSAYIVPHLLKRLEEPGINAGSKVMIEKIVSSLTDEQSFKG